MSACDDNDNLASCLEPPPRDEAFALLFETIPQPSWIFDAETRRVLDVNPAAIDFYGYSHDEFLALSCRQLWENDRVGETAPSQDAEAGGFAAREIAHRRKDGVCLAVQTFIRRTVCAGRDARLVFVGDLPGPRKREQELLQARDDLERRMGQRAAELIAANEELRQEVAHRRQAEMALREREEFFRHLSDNMTDMIAVIDRDGRRLYNSASYRDVLGESEGLQGTDSFADIHPDDQERMKRIFRQTLESGRGQRADFRFLLPDRSIRYVESQGSVIRDENGEVSKLVIVSRDMTDRKHAESQLNRLATALEAAAEAIIITDANEDIEYVNPAFERLTGYAEDDVIGRTPRSLKHVDEQASIEYSRAWDHLRRGIAWSGSLTDLRRDGTPYAAEETIAPIRDNQGALIGFVAVIRDITARHQAEESVRKLNEELETRVEQRTEQLKSAYQELEAFSYSVSHDLRAPLRAIDGFSRILLDDHAAQLSDEGRRLLSRVRANTRQMGTLISDLLAFSRLSRQALEKRPTPHRKLIDQALSDLREERQDRRIEVRIGALPDSRADPALLKQVYVNLLSNALKFTRDADPAEVEISAKDSDGLTVYCVRDNGVGFDAQYADKLFGVFQRLHRAEDYEGTGVGLAIVQRIVHRHGGEVWAESDPAGGASFYFTLESAEGASNDR